MRHKSIFIIFFLLPVSLFSSDINGEMLAKKLHLTAGTKAILQWERVFSSERKMKRYKIDTLTPKEQEALKSYLIDHAVDSDHPTIAGEMN